MQANGDAIGIFEELGSSVETLPDGTYSLLRYNATVENQPYTLYDLGINEDLLFSNVSEIRGRMNLQNSTLTKTPKLKTIKIRLDFGDNKTVDFPALERIGNCKIEWITPESAGL